MGRGVARRLTRRGWGLCRHGLVGTQGVVAGTAVLRMTLTGGSLKEEYYV